MDLIRLQSCSDKFIFVPQALNSSIWKNSDLDILDGIEDYPSGIDQQE
jgi:hypothetical protein